MLGKKFVFATIAVICVSVVAIHLKYAGDIYLKLVGSIVGLFMVAQGYVDGVKAKNGNSG